MIRIHIQKIAVPTCDVCGAPGMNVVIGENEVILTRVNECMAPGWEKAGPNWEWECGCRKRGEK